MRVALQSACRGRERAGERRDNASAAGAVAPRRCGIEPVPGLEKRHHCLLRGLACGSALHEIPQGAVEVALEDLGMHVALAADRFGVAERAGHRLDRPRDLALALALRSAGPERLQRERREYGTGPGAEILAGEILARNFLEVRVYVGGLDAPRLAILADIAEQLFTRQVVHVAHDSCKPPVVELDCVLDAAFAPEAELELRAAHAHLPLAQRGQSERLVLAGVLLVADAHARGLEQVHHRGKNFLARQAGEREVARDAPADPRQGAGKRDQASVLGLVAYLAPAA